MDKKKLGFGLMRLPLIDENDVTSINNKILCKMVDKFLDMGFHYFDTAAPYHGKASELAFQECVAKRYPRNAYTITDKMTFFMVQKTEEMSEFFENQLKRCGVEYFDYYLLHAMNRKYFKLAEEIGAVDFIRQKKKEGKIRHIGFSFHSTADVLEEFLIKYPDMEYVQLQINYADWEDSEIQSRKCYEICVKYNKPVIVMEPIKGGALVDIPEKAAILLKNEDADKSIASWAIRFAASLDNVVMVLSGMGNEAQMEDNTSYMKNFQVLTEKEKKIIHNVAEIIHSKEKVDCTFCRYCMNKCPKNIAIPDYFKLLNRINQFGEGQLSMARKSYIRRTQTFGKASDCICCGQCEECCPQHLPITKYLIEIAKMLDN